MDSLIWRFWRPRRRNVSLRGSSRLALRCLPTPARVVHTPASGRSITLGGLSRLALQCLPTPARIVYGPGTGRSLSLRGLSRLGLRTSMSNIIIAGVGSVNVRDFGATGDGTTDDKTAITNALNAAGANPVYFPAGHYYYNGQLVIPDYATLVGDGIWNQGITGGDGGTWLRTRTGTRFGSHLSVSKMLIGSNEAGQSCSFRPVARGASTAGAHTQANGSHGSRFSFVRFKGGSDGGGTLLSTESNWSADWTASLKTFDFYETSFDDCEFERPQATNSTIGTSSGEVVKMWTDVRPGGSHVNNLAWNRCHFGVKNSRNTGIDQYGCGRTIIFQDGPDCGGAGGPAPGATSSTITSSVWDSEFVWGDEVTQNFYDISFTDCLMEYSTWYPLNPCDYARAYSTWKSCEQQDALGQTYSGGVLSPWGNPIGSNWTEVPNAMWGNRFNLTRCYMKGSLNGYRADFEFWKNCVITGTVMHGYTGSEHVPPDFPLGLKIRQEYDNVVTDWGTFSQSTRPSTALFTVDWTGEVDDYTASPFDPA